MRKLTELNISVVVLEKEEAEPLIYTAEVQYSLNGSEFIQTYDFKADGTDNLEGLIKDVVSKIKELEDGGVFGVSRRLPLETAG